jgi:hypothetical protein
VRRLCPTHCHRLFGRLTRSRSPSGVFPSPDLVVPDLVPCMLAVAPVPLGHGAARPVPSSRTPVVVRSAPSVSTGTPLSSVLEPSPSSILSQSKAEDDCLTPEVRLHIALEVVAQLYKTEDFMWLSPEELSLREFLVRQISSLWMIVEA